VTSAGHYRQGLNKHQYCLLCGEDNPHSLGLRFTAQEDAVTAHCQLEPRLQGYGGLLHGGIISSLLDAAMTHCLFHQGIQALTGELTVRFLAPVPIDAGVELSARLLSQRRGILQLEATLSIGSKIHARANAKFLQPKPGVICHASCD